jgi:CheY-like chemotaxis protein
MNDSQGRCDVRSRILLVDDADPVRNLLYTLLESDGYEVLAASNGRDGLTICRQSLYPIELLVTDYTIPDMSGLELARECTRLNQVVKGAVRLGFGAGRRTPGGSTRAQTRFSCETVSRE